MQFRMRPVNCGLLSVLALWCGFPPQPESAAESSAGQGSASFGIAVWSNVPVDLPVSALEASAPPCI